jgi:hypothetical protein
MAARVRDFLRAHRPEGEEATALVRLEELVQRAEDLDLQQRAGIVATREASAKRARLRRALQSTLLRYLAGVGAAAPKENAALAVEFQLPRTRPTNLAFLTLARGMVDKATAQKELLMSRGMSATLLDDLAIAITAFEKTLEATRAGERDHVGATADLQAVGSAVSQHMRLLDGLVRYRFGQNPELMGAWASARGLGEPTRPKGEAEVSGVTLAVIKPAA